MNDLIRGYIKDINVKYLAKMEAVNNLALICPIEMVKVLAFGYH